MVSHFHAAPDLMPLVAPLPPNGFLVAPVPIGLVSLLLFHQHGEFIDAMTIAYIHKRYKGFFYRSKSFASRFLSSPDAMAVILESSAAIQTCDASRGYGRFPVPWQW